MEQGRNRLDGRDDTGQCVWPRAILLAMDHVFRGPQLRMLNNSESSGRMREGAVITQPGIRAPRRREAIVQRRYLALSVASMSCPMASLKSARNSSSDAPYISSRVRITKSTRPSTGRRYSRTASRILRLIRFRSTARRRPFAMIKPARGCAKGEGIARISRNLVRTRFPLLKTLVSSAFRVSR